MSRIVDAAEVGGVARLESLVLAVFGAGQRAPGWYADKLRRGCIDDRLSVVAVDPSRPIHSPRAWVGFVLVGAPPSLHPRARTAGTGVLARARGSGLGGRLLAAASERAAAAGHPALELFADPARLAFYERHGFGRVDRVLTLEADATGPPLAAPVDADLPFDLAVGDPALVQAHAWSPEAWSGSAARRRVTAGRGVALVSRVGPGAWLVHRWWRHVADPWTRAADALRAGLPQGDRVLLPTVSAVSDVTRNLVPHPFRPIQTGWLLRRSTAASTG